MTHKVPPDHPLWRFFAGTVEDAFYTQLGMCAPDLVNYLTQLLVKFVHINDIYSLKGPGGNVLDNLPEMVVHAHVGSDIPRRKRDLLVHRHIGDFTLYWTGVYPETLERSRGKRGQDFLLDYFAQGRRSYGIASELSGPSDKPPATVLRQLSDHFDDCVRGLALVRSNWDDSDQSGEFGALAD